MKHKYVVILELEGQTDSSKKIQITGNAIDEFCLEFFKDKNRILTVFRNLLYSYLSEGHHVFEKEDLEQLKESLVIENDLIKPVLEKLSPESKAEILEIVESCDDETFWYDFFASFSKFSINNITFMLSEKENK